MEVVISFLIGLIVLIAIIPAEQIYKRNKFKKIMEILHEDGIDREKKDLIGKTILDKIARLGMKVKIPIIRSGKVIEKEKKIERKLRKAGLNKRFNYEKFNGLKKGMLLCGIVYGMIFFHTTNNGFISFIYCLVGPIGYMWPNLWLQNLIVRRKSAIQREMPFILSSMAIMIESGQSLLQSIKEVSKMKDGALVEEFQITVLEIDMGYSRIRAFERMMNRVEITELSVFLSALTQSIDKGSDGIGALLKKQSDAMWKKRKEKAKEMAEKASIKLFLPLLLFVLPSLMIFILTPAIISLLKIF